jgi:hypothetical protein
MDGFPQYWLQNFLTQYTLFEILNISFIISFKTRYLAVLDQILLFFVRKGGITLPPTQPIQNGSRSPGWGRVLVSLSKK